MTKEEEAVKFWTKVSEVKNREYSKAAKSFWILTNTHLILIVTLQSSYNHQKLYMKFLRWYQR